MGQSVAFLLDPTRNSADNAFLSCHMSKPLQQLLLAADLQGTVGLIWAGTRGMAVKSRGWRLQLRPQYSLTTEELTVMAEGHCQKVILCCYLSC